MAAARKPHPMEYEAEVKMISVMRRVLSKNFPVLVNRGNRDKWYSSHRLGVSGPQPSRSDSHYGERRGKQLIKAYATDIFLDADKEYEKKLGDALFEAFVSLTYRDRLGIIHVVWDRKKYDPVEEEIRDFPKPPKKCNQPAPWRRKSCLHSDHLHVEFDPKNGDRDCSDLLERIVGEIKAKIGSGSP